MKNPERDGIEKLYDDVKTSDKSSGHFVMVRLKMVPVPLTMIFSVHFSRFLKPSCHWTIYIILYFHWVEDLIFPYYQS